MVKFIKCSPKEYGMLNILKDTDYLQEKEFESMNTDCQEILALLISSIKTTKHNNETK